MPAIGLTRRRGGTTSVMAVLGARSLGRLDFEAIPDMRWLLKLNDLAQHALLELGWSVGQDRNLEPVLARLTQRSILAEGAILIQAQSIKVFDDQRCLAGIQSHVITQPPSCATPTIERDCPVDQVAAPRQRRRL